MSVLNFGYVHWGKEKNFVQKKIIIFYLSSSISHFFISLLFKLTPSSGSDKKATEVWWINSRCKPKADQRIPNLGQLPILVKKIIQRKVKTYVQSSFLWPSTPWSQYAYSPYSSLQLSTGIEKENLFNNQKSFLSWWSFPLFSWRYCLIQGWYCMEKLDASRS